jgi:hypothetical protein
VHLCACVCMCVHVCACVWICVHVCVHVCGARARAHRTHLTYNYIHTSHTTTVTAAIQTSHTNTYTLPIPIHTHLTYYYIHTSHTNTITVPSHGYIAMEWGRKMGRVDPAFDYRQCFPLFFVI